MKLKPIIQEILDKIQYKYINEGLIVSYDVNRIIGILWRGNFNAKLYKDELNRFIVRCDTDDCDFEGLFAIVEKSGWFPAYLFGINKMNAKSDKYTDKHFADYKIGFEIIEILFEPKYDVPAVNLPKYLYHFTQKLNWHRISKNGLSPKTQSKTSTIHKSTF